MLNLGREHNYTVEFLMTENCVVTQWFLPSDVGDEVFYEAYEKYPCTNLHHFLTTGKVLLVLSDTSNTNFLKIYFLHGILFPNENTHLRNPV